MYRISLPRLGQTMEQGTVVRWLKAEGQPLGIGDELYEIETEKTVLPVQCTRQGTLLRVVAEVGEIVAVGGLLAIAGEPGETATPDQVSKFALQAAENENAASDSAPTVNSDASTAAPGGARTAIMPKARLLAVELGVDISAVAGTGPDGAITTEDVRAASEARSATAQRAPPDPTSRSSATRAVNAALEKSAAIPQFTQITLVDAAALEQRKTESGGRLSYMDFLLDALLGAAALVPGVLRAVRDGGIEYHGKLNVTIATVTEFGLRVPVLHDAASLTIDRRAEAWRALVQKARDNTLQLDEVSGGTIALSNLGQRGVDTGSPLLPYGHALIAFAGSVKPRPMVLDGQVVARPSLYLSVTYDHRIVDGVDAARFTSAMVDELQNSAAAGRGIAEGANPTRECGA
jgi:pyruvate dehydrogenase E2 component (dihydrolipoamide acetyltransferase)